MKLRKKIKRYLVFRLATGLRWFFSTVPRILAVYIGGWIALAAWQLSPKERYKAHRHLTLVYGERYTRRQKAAIGRSFAVNEGRNLADVLRFKKHFSSEIKPLVSVEGWEHFEAAARLGKGVVGITGHIGNFELLAAWVASQGYRAAAIGRELYDSRLDRLLLENREAVGITTIATTDSPKRMIKWLRDGNILGVLIDTDSHRIKGEFIPAFGRWSYTPVGQSILGLKTGAAFVPIACVRSGGNRYRIIVRPAVTVEPGGDFDTEVRQITLKCTKALESIISDHKDQWIWIHNRWRTRKNNPA
ncbi:MAG: lysophospholipid acyltransferase family protein [bacterium]|nr:lysophospholipid acyltransferase family protein [bacterium]